MCIQSSIHVERLAIRIRPRGAHKIRITTKVAARFSASLRTVSFSIHWHAFHLLDFINRTLFVYVIKVAFTCLLNRHNAISKLKRILLQHEQNYFLISQYLLASFWSLKPNNRNIDHSFKAYRSERYSLMFYKYDMITQTYKYLCYESQFMILKCVMLYSISFRRINLSILIQNIVIPLRKTVRSHSHN